MHIITGLPANIKKVIFALFQKQEVHYIGGPATLPPPLSKAEEQK